MVDAPGGEVVYHLAGGKDDYCLRNGKNYARGKITAGVGDIYRGWRENSRPEPRLWG
jgi:hypothetical protein